LLCQADITRPATQAEVRRRLVGRQANAVLSDMAPNPSGDPGTDHIRIIKLCQLTLEFVMKPDPAPILVENGKFLCKIWDGSQKMTFIELLKEYFKLVKILKPDASRGHSAEIYIFASGFIRQTG